MKRLSGKLREFVRHLRRTAPVFSSSATYWRDRYKRGGHSGLGSRGSLAVFKAAYLNDFLSCDDIESVIEFGCGDGHQIALCNYPVYAGFDISPDAVHMAKERISDDSRRRVATMDEYRGEQAEVSISLDVIYHLVEDPVFEEYMVRLFDASTKYVIIYSSNYDSAPGDTAAHVRHREFSRWIGANRPGWRMIDHTGNPYPSGGDERRGSGADFYLYRRLGD